MDVAHRFGYWIGAASFAIGLVWNALRIAGMLPPDLNNAPLSISVLVFGSLLIGWVKVNSARRAEHGTSQSYKDTYLAWLSDDATPDFSPTPPRPPDMRDQPDPRRGFTPLEPHVNYPLHLGRTRFDIRFPQCRTQSWIGGQPELPDDVIWPTRNGAFEPFVAQIALSDLSPLIWGGCFRDADVAGSSLVVFEHTVLRLNSAGQPRPLPDDMTPVGLRDITIAERLQALGAERPFAAPRWFLTPCDDASGVLCPVGMLASYQDLFAEAGLQDIRFQPFDWVTARCLIDDLRANLERMVAGLSEDSIQDRSSDIPERRNATREMMADLNYLEGQIEARALDHAYSDSDRAWLMGQLDPMTNTAWISGNAEENGVKPRKLLELPIFTPYLKLFEFHARQVYCDDPQNLPFEARRMLERHWGQQARHERIYAGNSREDADLPVQDPVVLITQSPVLVSSDVGRTGRRAWHLDEDAARNGLFDRVAAIDIPMDKTDQTRSNNTDPTE